MSKHKITLKRAHSSVQGFLATNEVGTDGLTAMLAIPDVDDAEVISESEQFVIIEYSWSGENPVVNVDSYLIKFGLARVE